MNRLVFISGYTEDMGSPDSGVVGMHHEAATDPNLRSNSIVDYVPWNANMDALAENIYRFAVGNGGLRQTKVGMVSYSWGCWTAILLARQLRRRGLQVSMIVFCDPVYRHWYSLGQWRAMVPYTIKVPSNVKQATWICQKNPRYSLQRKQDGGNFASPAGHNLVFENPETKVRGPIVLPEDHSYIDNSPTFRTETKYAIANMISGVENEE